jgi:hypothetical protein
MKNEKQRNEKGKKGMNRAIAFCIRVQPEA